MDVDKFLEKTLKCQTLDESEMKRLCLKVKNVLLQEPNIVDVKAPVAIVGDVHGQFHDLLHIFKVAGGPDKMSYLFMGDFVDRGYHSLETFTLLLLYKLKYPDSFTLIRGNHECRQITAIYGLYDELQRKYGSTSVWHYLCEVFDCLPIVGLVNNEIFCVHGGLSPQLRTLEEMQTLYRRKEIPQEGPLCDLLWSDPENILTWEISQRGAGWLFGSKVVKEFNHLNDLSLICRAHQLINEGFKFHYDDKSIVTVWSAPNYCYRCENQASVLVMDEELERRFIVFKETPENRETLKLIQEQKPVFFSIFSLTFSLLF